MAFGAPFGGDAAQFGGLPPEVLAALQQLQAQQQAAQADPQAPQQPAPVAQGPGSPDALLYNRAPMGGGLNPFVGQDQGPTTTGSTPTPNVPVAMSEADTRQMERAMMPPDARAVPLPPGRPSDADLMAPAPVPRVDGMNPGRSGTSTVPGMPGVPAQPSVTAASTGNPDASNVAPVNSFDPLTGQPVSGNPKPMRAPGEGGPTEGAGRVAAAAGNPASTGQSPNLLERFAKGLNNPEVGNLLLNVGIGLMSQRGFGPGIAAGLQGYQSAQAGGLKNALEQLKLQQTLQGQQAIRSALKAKGVPDHMIEAAALNPTVLSSVMGQLNQKTPEQIQAEAQASATGSRLGGQQLADKIAEADALASVKDKHAKDDVAFVSDGQGGTIAVNKSNLFPGKDPATGEQGGDSTTRTLVPPQPDKKANEGLDKLIGDNITGGYQKAQGAVGTLAAISRQKEALDRGVIAGAGADWRTKAQALGAQFLGIDPSQLNDTYNFDAASTQKQAELAKAVSQAGHTTNMDLQLGKTIAGGDRSKTEQALRQIVDAQETLARDAIDRHNAALDRYAKIAPEAAARTGFFRVDTPEVYKYGQGTPNPLADPGARMPSQNAIPKLDVGGTHQFQGITIKRVR